MELQPLSLPRGRQFVFPRPAGIMAIVNCTTDSFFAGSHNDGTEAAVERALRALACGAAIIDFGAESTRPGSVYVDAEEEARRLVPVIRAFRSHSDAPVSVDTRKASVARAALDAGADIINDISALEDDAAMAILCAARNAPVVLMHKKGQPRTMQNEVRYDDVVGEVKAYLLSRARFAEEQGIPRHNIILDPGIGFGKRLEDNIALIAATAEFAALAYPYLMALSRKTCIGQIIGSETKAAAPEERLAGTLVANLVAVQKGAALIRVHDVKEAADTLKILRGINGEGKIPRD